MQVLNTSIPPQLILLFRCSRSRVQKLGSALHILQSQCSGPNFLTKMLAKSEAKSYIFQELKKLKIDFLTFCFWADYSVSLLSILLMWKKNKKLDFLYIVVSALGLKSEKIVNLQYTFGRQDIDKELQSIAASRVFSQCLQCLGYISLWRSHGC